MTKSGSGRFVLLIVSYYLGRCVQNLSYDQLSLTIRTFCRTTVQLIGSPSITGSVTDAVFQLHLNYCRLSRCLSSVFATVQQCFWLKKSRNYLANSHCLTKMICTRIKNKVTERVKARSARQHQFEVLVRALLFNQSKFFLCV